MKKNGSDHHAPQSAPERTGLAPVLHPVTGVVVPDRVFFGVGILADDRQHLHVDSAALQLLHCLLGFDVSSINCDDGIQV
jgi:hypothetical protein